MNGASYIMSPPNTIIISIIIIIIIVVIISSIIGIIGIIGIITINIVMNGVSSHHITPQHHNRQHHHNRCHHHLHRPRFQVKGIVKDVASGHTGAG